MPRRLLPVPTPSSSITSKIREEIFALFFVLVILALANDPTITEKVRSNTSIQIAIGLAVVYCIYNRIPWSVAFLLLFGVAVGFSGLLRDAWSSVQRTFPMVQTPPKEEERKPVLKKTVTFEEEKKEENKEESDSESECDEVSQYFGWNSDTDTENEGEDEREERKKQLKTFMTDKKM